MRVQLQQRHSEQLETCGPEHEQLQRRSLLSVTVQTSVIIIIFIFISVYSLAAAAPRALRRSESWEHAAARGARPLPSGPR